MVKKSEYNAVDLVKFLMSICVVAIHTQPFFGCEKTMLLSLFFQIEEMAVPFFFLASGFFLAMKLERPFALEKNRNVVARYLKRMVKLYVLWELSYLPLNIYGLMEEGYSFGKGCVFLVRDFLLIGSGTYSWMMWYMLSTVYAVLVIWLLMKTEMSEKALIPVGLTAFLLSSGCSFLTEYNGELPYLLAIARKLTLMTVYNGALFRGSYFIPLGMLLAKIYVPKWVNGLLLAAGFVGINIYIYIYIYTEIRLWRTYSGWSPRRDCLA